MFYSVLKTRVAKKTKKELKVCFDVWNPGLTNSGGANMELTPRTDTVRTENMHKVVTRELRMKNVGFFYCQSAVC